MLLNQGAIMAIVLFGGTLAFVLGVVLIALYKRTVRRYMRRAVAVGQIGDKNNSPRRKPQSHLTYSIELPGRAEGAEQPVSASFDLTLGASAIYSIAGLIFAIVATALLFACSGIQFLPLRTVGVAWAYAWPIVLALNLLWSSDKQRQLAVVAVYIGVIAVLSLVSAFSGSRPSTIATIGFPAFANPILLWGIFAGPSV